MCDYLLLSFNVSFSVVMQERSYSGNLEECEYGKHEAHMIKMFTENRNAYTTQDAVEDLVKITQRVPTMMHFIADKKANQLTEMEPSYVELQLQLVVTSYLNRCKTSLCCAKKRAVAFEPVLVNASAFDMKLIEFCSAMPYYVIQKNGSIEYNFVIRGTDMVQNFMELIVTEYLDVKFNISPKTIVNGNCFCVVSRGALELDAYVALLSASELMQEGTQEVVVYVPASKEEVHPSSSLACAFCMFDINLIERNVPVIASGVLDTFGTIAVTNSSVLRIYGISNKIKSAVANGFCLICPAGLDMELDEELKGLYIKAPKNEEELVNSAGVAFFVYAIDEAVSFVNMIQNHIVLLKRRIESVKQLLQL